MIYDLRFNITEHYVEQLQLLLQPVACASAELVRLLVCMYIRVISELYVAVLQCVLSRVCTVHHYGIIMPLKVCCGSCHVHQQPHWLSLLSSILSSSFHCCDTHPVISPLLIFSLSLKCLSFSSPLWSFISLRCSRSTDNFLSFLPLCTSVLSLPSLDSLKGMSDEQKLKRRMSHCNGESEG